MRELSVVDDKLFEKRRQDRDAPRLKALVCSHDADQVLQLERVYPVGPSDFHHRIERVLRSGTCEEEIPVYGTVHADTAFPPAADLSGKRRECLPQGVARELIAR